MTTAAPATSVAAPAAPKAIRAIFPINNQPVVFESLLMINNPQTLVEFRNQFGALEAQVNRIIGINQRIQQALTTAEKDALAKVREQEVRDLDAKDSLFQKVYNFRVAALAGRPTVIKSTAVRLLTPATDEEISKARADGKLKEEDVIIRGDRKLLAISTMTGEHIPLFERNVGLVQAQRQNLVQLKTAIDQAAGEAKAKLEEQFKKDEATLIKNNDEMIKTYGFSLTRNFEAEILEGIFFVALTAEEAQKALAEPQAAEAAPEAAPAKKAAADKAKN